MKKDIQVKFKIKDIRKLIDEIQRQNYIFVGGNFEKINRYDFADDKLLNRGIFIRTKTGINEVLTIKEKNDRLSQNKYFERDTVETEVENCDVIDYIFRRIGLTKIYVMEKYRLTFKKGKSTICIDELPFGLYCDIRDTEKNIDKLLNMFEVIV